MNKVPVRIYDHLDCGREDQCGDGDKNFPNVGFPCRKHAIANSNKWRDYAKAFQNETKSMRLRVLEAVKE